MYEMKLSDLRALAKCGNATVKLNKSHQFKVGEIHRDGIYTLENHAIVAGRKAKVKFRSPFHEVYKDILTVKLGRVLLAERKKNGKLLATAKYEQMLAERQKIEPKNAKA